MSLTNTEIRYGAVTKGFHWLTALLIFTLIPLGLVANWLPYETDTELARKAWMFSLHKTMGVIAFFVAVLRIFWALSQPKPGLLNADNKVESFAAEIVHWMLYGALVIVPLSGWIGHAAAAGFAPIWWPFGQGLPLVPKSVDVEHFFGGVHWVATKLLAVSLLLHIAGALKHHLIDKDVTLQRMLPGVADVGPLPEQRHSITPLAGAALVWVLAIALGGVLASSNTKEAVAAVALEDVSSDWRVLDGSIGLTVTQFGSDVPGQFDSWTAAITFDPSATEGDVGQVTTTVAIASLQLGSVSQQAMGADFFDVANHETAVFDAVIRKETEGYVAEGTLQIKGNSVPVVMPFELGIEGDVATMQSTLTLDRRDFAIGAGVGDEASLAFAVNLAIALTATSAAE